MSATEPKPAPLDPKDYEIVWLKLRNEQLHRRIAVLEKQLKETARDPWAAGEGEV